MTKTPSSSIQTGASSSDFHSDQEPGSGAADLAGALVRAQTGGMDRLDAQLLLLHALGRAGTGRAWLVAHSDTALAPEVALAFNGFCMRRAAGEPLAYIVGSKEFFGLTLQVDARVLIPRPDTETLVHWALERLQGQPPECPAPRDDGWRVLDLGCGSGAIALALSAQLAGAEPQARIIAADFSQAALDLAQINHTRLHQPDRPAVEFRLSNWFDQVAGPFDLIVSNPPYIASADPHLAALTHEPLSALAAGSEGLDDLEKIIAAAPSHLRSGGWLLLEHGHDQASAVRACLIGHGFAQIESRRDLGGHERCTGGRWIADPA
jgi:release factor glutamine methyltransferase